MMTFDDFDAWGDAVRGADLRLVCDGIETPQWRLIARKVGPVVVQLAHEGGGNLCYGGNTHQGTTLWMPLTAPEHQVANCERFDERSVLVIPPGGDFCIQVRNRAHAWCSIALPDTTATGDSATASYVLRADALPVQRLKRLIERVALAPEFDESSAAATAAAAQLVAGATACLARPVAAGACLGRPKIDRAEVVRRIARVLDADPMSGRSIAGLAEAAGVTGRTLARVFRDAYGVSPRRYVQLRTLHTVRRALHRGDPRGNTVARILAAYGIWELGRFAGTYRRHFGESPSETLYRGG